MSTRTKQAKPGEPGGAGGAPASQAHVDQRSAAEIERGVLDQISVSDHRIQVWFGRHETDEEQQQQIERVRRACAACAQIIKDNTLNGPDQSAAVRRVREGMFTAHAAIACRGR